LGNCLVLVDVDWVRVHAIPSCGRYGTTTCVGGYEAGSDFPLLVMPGGGLPLPALDEFDSVAIGIFDHGSGGPGPDGGFGPRRDAVFVAPATAWAEGERSE